MLVAVLSDIHGNLAALDAVLSKLPAVDGLWCLGDIVGYGPYPNECIDRLRQRNVLACIAGNHDWAAIGKLTTDGFNTEAAESAAWTARSLTPTSAAFLSGLPTRLETEGWTLVHGSPRDEIIEYVFDCRSAAANFPSFATAGCLTGHTHVPSVFIEESDASGRRRCESAPIAIGTRFNIGRSRVIINPGSVGQPRDGDPDASYLLLDTATSSAEFGRASYDVKATQAEMRRVGLPTRMWQRLGFGL